MKRMNPILKNGVRILRPSEIKAITDSIPKMDHKDKLEALLYTGCRYTELQWLYTHQDAFQRTTILMPSTKPEARHKERYIRLNANGIRAVTYFLRSKTNLPAHAGWDENLIRWCSKAGILPDGVCCKSTRKTWESWLATMYPNNFQQIFLSQGHTERVSMEYYLMLPYDEEDKKDMGFYTDGWI
jgi:integrase